MLSPTARTLALLRGEGWDAEVVEKWNHVTRTRKDLYGFIDIVGVRDEETIGVQSTSYSNVSARIKKIQAEPKAVKWLRANNRIQVQGWRKIVGSRRWTCRIVDLTLKDGLVVVKE